MMRQIVAKQDLGSTLTASQQVELKQTTFKLRQTLTEQERQDLTETVKSLREDLLEDDVKLTYRFRGHKLYLNVKLNDNMNDGYALNQIIRPMMKEYFPRCHLTSGSWVMGDFTFRANP